MKYGLIFVCVSGLMIGGCVKPEEETSSKFQRQTNIEKYVKKAHHATQLQQQRHQPLAVQDPLDLSRLLVNTEEVDITFLTKAFERSRHFLAAQMKESEVQQRAQQLTQLADQYKQQLQQAAQEFTSQELLEDQVMQALTDQQTAVKQFLTQQQTEPLPKPDQAALDRVTQRLHRRCEDFSNQLAVSYGMQTARAVQPVLDKAITDFIYLVTKSATEQETEDQMGQIVLSTRSQLQEQIDQTADPTGPTSEEEIAALRAQMIATHQQLENNIEYLYGKEAVLQARKPFNRLLEDTQAILRQDMRLSQKKNTLARFNLHYKDSLLDLQEQWNKELEVLHSVKKEA